MITIKLKLKEEQKGYQKLLKQFNNIVRYAYNRYCDNNGIIKDSDIIKLVKTNMNNIEQLDASIIQFAVAKSKQIYKTNGQKVIFGGKTNYKRYLQGLIKKLLQTDTRCQNSYSDLQEKNKNDCKHYLCHLNIKDSIDICIFHSVC